jgi:hypothetical protein
MATLAIHQGADYIAQGCEGQIDLYTLLQPITCTHAARLLGHPQ